jgi:hypothetical protein
MLPFYHYWFVLCEGIGLPDNDPPPGFRAAAEEDRIYLSLKHHTEMKKKNDGNLWTNLAFSLPQEEARKR